MGSIDQTKTAFGRTSARPGPAYLLIVENDSSRVVHLPHDGAVVIGRTSEADIQLNHGSVSRRHATIRIDDHAVRIADLGSHNGTRVNGELVQESRTLASGDVAMVGDVVLVVHISNPPVLSRAILSESGWRRRIVEEIERAMTHQRTLAVIAIEAVRPDSASLLGEALRLIDVVGEGSDGQMLLLLPETDRTHALTTAARVIDIVTGSHPSARGGVALCPCDGVDGDTLLQSARRAARHAKPATIAEASVAAACIELGPRRIHVVDPAMTRVYALLERLAPSALPVLINGETGVGKENAAFAVHHWSRRTGDFIAVNCAALGPETLVDSVLFGHDKGAFTGATAAKPGLFESAAGGTVFLDEVGELPLATQAKLLRVLENKTVTRLGETRERPIDARLVAATNRALEDEVRQGRFRQDLLFRLAVATVVLPPLRDRRCEIPVIARALLADACTRAERAAMTITAEAMQALLTYDWPGNVRELRNAMDYVTAAAPDERVELTDLPERLGGAPTTQPAAREPEPVTVASGPTTTSFRPINDEIRELERRRMSEALAASGGVRTRAAQLIDMPIRTFTLKLKQYKL